MDEGNAMPKLNSKLKYNSQQLRKNMTKEEKHLWYDFFKNYSIPVKRQKVLGPYIADFYCPSAKLVIELDGSQHYIEEGQKYDTERDKYMENLGIKVLRYSNYDIKKNFVAVCEEIKMYIEDRANSLKDEQTGILEKNNKLEPSSVTCGDTFPQRGKASVYFVGAGCGAADLITVRGMRLLEKADVIIYAGSLVNPQLLDYAKEGCEIHNSATMTLDEVIAVIVNANQENKMIVRLHTGEPSIYGAVQEQMQRLEALGISYESCPGVSACFGAAASLNLEYTLPDISQSLIITRMEGRTSVPEKESIESFAAHQASMAIYLSAGMMEELQERLIKGGYDKNTPAAIVYKASWPDEEKYICTVESLANTAKAKGISNLAVILVGDVISKSNYSLSKLYDPTFETGFRKATED